MWERFGCTPDQFDQLDSRVYRWLEIESVVREAQARTGGGQ